MSPIVRIRYAAATGVDGEDVADLSHLPGVVRQFVDEILAIDLEARIVVVGDLNHLHVNGEFADQVKDHEPRVVRLAVWPVVCEWT